MTMKPCPYASSSFDSFHMQNILQRIWSAGYPEMFLINRHTMSHRSRNSKSLGASLLDFVKPAVEHLVGLVVGSPVRGCGR